MEKTFDPDAFIRRIGDRLVQEFKHAKAGTTPSAVGSATEQPVRDQLAQMLPRGKAVGEGFVIDSYGETSRQEDVVLYERDICPHILDKQYASDDILPMRRRDRCR